MCARWVDTVSRVGARGVTLVEVLVVVTIMALVAGAVTVVVIPQVHRARIKTAILDAKAIKGVAELQLGEDANAQCPTVDELVKRKKLSADNSADPWDSAYQIVCDGDEVRVFSPGRDRQADTPDDVWHYFKPADVDRVAEL